MAIQPATDISQLSIPQKKWFKEFLICLNRTEAAEKAYKTKNRKSLWELGSQNFRRCSKLIGLWLDENGLSKEALESRLVKGFDVKETKFFPYRTKDEKTGEERQIIDKIEVESIGEQRRYLEMGMRAKGMFKEDNEQGRQTVIIRAGEVNKPPESGT